MTLRALMTLRLDQTDSVDRQVGPESICRHASFRSSAPPVPHATPRNVVMPAAWIERITGSMVMVHSTAAAFLESSHQSNGSHRPRPRHRSWEGTGTSTTLFQMKVQPLDELTDDQLLRKLAVLTEMAKPLLARLPAVIDAAPVRADVGAETNTEDEYR
jgi:hypothetical protein